MQPFKERLVTRRNALSLSQMQLAEKSRVSERSIAEYETSDKLPTGRILGKLAVALDCSPAWLMGGESQSNHLREECRESELEVWRARAKAAEQEMESMRVVLRMLVTSKDIPGLAGKLAQSQRREDVSPKGSSLGEHPKPQYEGRGKHGTFLSSEPPGASTQILNALQASLHKPDPK